MTTPTVTPKSTPNTTPNKPLRISQPTGTAMPSANPELRPRDDTCTLAKPTDCDFSQVSN
ncbi:hypothetical protein ACWDUL_01725 [Nocardia niigatensis]